MMKTLILFFLACIAINASAQRTFHISYDKANDTWSYSQVKIIDGKSEKVPLKKRLPKLKETDIVEVEVVNYNPFLYYVDIQQEDNVVTTGGTSGVTGIVNLLSGGLGMFSGLEVASSLLGGSTRGETEAVDVANSLEFEMYTKDAQLIASQINNFSIRYKKFQHAIELLESENLASNKEEVIQELEQCKKEYFNPEQLLTEYFPTMNLHYLKSGVNDDRYKTQMNDLEAKVKQFKEELVTIEGTYTKEAIQHLISQLKTLDFTQSVKFQMGKTEQFTLKANDDELAQNEVLFGKRFVLNFYNRHDLNNTTSRENNFGEPTYVRYYWPNRFWTPKGELANKKCIGCQPVVAAEGLYDGNPPRNLFELWSDKSDIPDEWPESRPLVDDAINDWVFYDTNGVVNYISVAPRFEEDLSSKWEKELSKIYVSDELENKPHQRRMVEMPVSGGFNVSWSSGVYAVGAFGSRFNYSLTPNATLDSVVLNGVEVSNIRTCIGSQMDFQFFGNKLITPTVNLGAAMDVWNERDVHFLLGGGLRFKAFPYLGFTGGISFTRMQVLNENVRIGDVLEEDGTLDVMEYTKTINGALVVEKKYRPGYYFGINIAF